MKKILIPLSLLLLAACGEKTNTTPQSQIADANLETLSVKFEPDTTELTLYGLLRRKDPSYETEFFYFKGTVPAQELTDPLKNRKLALQCEDTPCHEFSFTPRLERLSLAAPVRAQVVSVASARSEVSEAASTAAFPTVWRELLTLGVDTKRSSIATALWSEKSFFGILLAGTAGSKTQWLHVAGEKGNEAVSVNYSYVGASGPELTLGQEQGTIGSDGPTPWAISLTGGRLFLQTRD